MIYWGVTCGSHDGALAVYDSEKKDFVFATDAERFSRKKNDPEIPDSLIEYVKDKYGEPKEVFFYENPYVKVTRRMKAGQKPAWKPPTFPYKMRYSSHHKSHAAYGYYTSPFDECMILSLDAIGEWETMTMWHVKDHKFKKLKNWKYPKSLGLMYSALTQAAGWKPNEEEYIMMGAAARQTYPYDVAVDRIRDCWETKDVTWHKGMRNIPEWNISPEIHPDDIPTAAQQVYEEEFVKLLKELSEHKLNNGNIVFVGGCALNVSANRYLSHFFSNIHIPSNPGDSGSAMGCILARVGHHISSNPYLGYDIEGPYPFQEIIDGLMIERVVGVANGRCEFGPRALGNRTLFGDPRDKKIKEKINETKGREQFRPFAPMILEEDVHKYFNGGFLSPFMSCALEATEEFKQNYPGVVHLDGTSRLQVVNQEPHITLLKVWKDITKCPVLLNTSLNVKGQPIVNTKEDAKDFTQRTGVAVHS